jgi:hypothetical protein
MRIVLAALLWLAVAACARAEPLLHDWAILVVAADQTASNGARTDGFDNARRELAAAFLKKGARPEHLRQFSVDPARDPATRPLRSEPGELDRALGSLTREARGGCLLYFTSHGDPGGIVMGSGRYGPAEMAGLADRHCAGRPTVVVVSACYSGVFVPRLLRPERLVLTAARPDRSSFGCGQDDRMPYFDACVLQSLPDAGDFDVLTRQARLCVAAEERARRLRPPSEPQAAVGAEMRALLPLLRFDG